MSVFRPIRAFRRAAASAALAAAPPGAAADGDTLVALCGGDGKRFIEIDTEGGAPGERGAGACHVACLDSRKPAKPRPAP